MERKGKNTIMKRAIKRKRQDGIVEEVDTKQATQSEEIEVEKQKDNDWVDDEDQSQEYEDEVEDEYEEEQVNELKGEGEWESEEQVQAEQFYSKQKQKTTGKQQEAYVGNEKKLEKGEYLEFDNKAYDMLHRMTTEWPCLSFDFILGEDPFKTGALPLQSMTKYPYEIFTVQGTQAESGSNQLYVARWHKLHKTKYDDDSEDCQDEQDDDLMNDQDPEIDIAYIDIKYPVNRLRTLNSSSIVAYWNQNAQVTIMDLSKKYRALQQQLKTNPKQKVDRKVYKESAQGFAINWNPRSIGQLATGNMNCEVTLYSAKSDFSDWQIMSKYKYHKASVEDIQFSPVEEYVFASCSADKTVQIVDTRVGDLKKSQLLIKAHKKDVNVLDWNGKATNIIATGSDDKTVKLWDLRMIKQSDKQEYEQLICFSWHEDSITSIAFQPGEQSVICVASDDNRVSVWDLAVENEKTQDVPNELMFLHQGQQEIKEIRYHPVYYEMIVSTASNGLNAFKPSFTAPEEQDEQDDMKKPPIRESELGEYINRLSLN